MNARALRSWLAPLMVLPIALAACQPNAALPSDESGVPTAALTESASAEPSPSPSASSSPTTAPPSASSPSIGALDVEGFAEVVADRVQMRVAPGLAAELVVRPLYGDYPSGTPFPPVIMGRDTGSTRVYLLDGPTAMDGFEWYLVAEAEEESIWPGLIGWVAAGDAEDAWLVPATVPCPDDPVELADVTMMAMSRLRAIHCLGGREITLRGYYVAPPPGETGGGECVAGEPAWLICDFGWHELRTVKAGWAGDANWQDLQLPPDLGPMPPRPGWIEVTGQFDHPAAAQCGDGRPASNLGCRTEFVVVSARAVE